MQELLSIFEPNLKITFSTLLAFLPYIFFLFIIYRIARGKKNFELVKAELSITNPKLYYELNKDKVKKDLILENGVLKEKIKALEKKNSSLSFIAIIFLILAIISAAFKNKK